MPPIRAGITQQERKCCHGVGSIFRVMKMGCPIHSEFISCLYDAEAQSAASQDRHLVQSWESKTCNVFMGRVSLRHEEQCDRKGRGRGTICSRPCQKIQIGMGHGGVKKTDFAVRKTWILISTLPFALCVIWGRLTPCEVKITYLLSRVCVD